MSSQLTPENVAAIDEYVKRLAEPVRGTEKGIRLFSDLADLNAVVEAVAPLADVVGSPDQQQFSYQQKQN